MTVPGTVGQGYSTQGDVVSLVTGQSQLVVTTADMVELNTLWQEIQAALAASNAAKDPLINVLTYATTDAATAIPAALQTGLYEEASEFGEPVGARVKPEWILRGFDYNDYDRATRFTSLFLRDATAEQIRAVANQAIEDDRRTSQYKVFQRLFDPTPVTNGSGFTCYGLHNADGEIPPPVLGQTFTGTHTHALTSGATTIDPTDVLDAVKSIREHGYSLPGDPASALLVLCHPTESEVIQSWCAGDDANSKFDFIPSTAAPPFWSPTGGELVGRQPTSSYEKMEIIGQWGPCLVHESYFIPEYYVVAVATGGRGSPNNVIGIRSHTNPNYVGLRQIAGGVFNIRWSSRSIRTASERGCATGGLRWCCRSPTRRSTASRRSTSDV